MNVSFISTSYIQRELKNQRKILRMLECNLMTQNYTLTSRRKQVQEKCCVAQCNIKCTFGNQRMLTSCRYDTLKGMSGNDDAFWILLITQCLSHLQFFFYKFPLKLFMPIMHTLTNYVQYR